MTSATSRSNLVRTRGFSLVELLVVIGIILVLAGIALPMLIKAYSQADKSKAASDLNTIGIALEAYKQDFGDYPRPAGKGLGAAILCKALAAPGPANSTAAAWSSSTSYSAGEMVDSGGTLYVAIKNTSAGQATSDTTAWTAYSDADGADGLGFRVRAGMGQVKPPYLQLDRIKVRGGMLTNKDGNPILYYSVNPVRPNIAAIPSTTNGGYCHDSYALANAGFKRPLYDAGENVSLLSQTNLRAMLGDYSVNGFIDSTNGVEQPVLGYGYLLFSAGSDGAFGPTTTIQTTANPVNWAANKNAVAACDDVTNFTRP